METIKIASAIDSGGQLCAVFVLHIYCFIIETLQTRLLFFGGALNALCKSFGTLNGFQISQSC